MEPVRALRHRARLTQSGLARVGGTSQPAIAAYESRAKSPTLRTLDRLAFGAGWEMAITFVPPLTREDRRSLELHRSIAEKLEADPRGVVDRARRNLTHMAAANPDAAPLLRQWRRALARPVDELVELLNDPRPAARELRQVTPFAGVLTPSERWAVYRHFHSQDARS